MELASTAGCW